MMMMNRNERVLQYVEKSMKIIEIGPSFNPLAPRSQGWNTKIIDHLSREDLVKKYQGQQTQLIEDVDFIWSAGPIETAVPEELHGTFDVCVASHLVEHTPDFIGFFKSMSKLVKPDGLIVIAIPDRRFMFDFFRPLTLTDRILEAHWEKRTRHTKGTIFGNAAYQVQNNGMIAWCPTSTMTAFAFVGAPLTTSAQSAEAVKTDESCDYIDCHNWSFTPSSLKLIMLELSFLDLFPFTLIRLNEPSDTCEISFTLRNTPGPKVASSSLDASRIKLLNQIHEESKISATPSSTARSSSNATEHLSKKRKIIRGSHLLIDGLMGAKFASIAARLANSVGLIGGAR